MDNVSLFGANKAEHDKRLAEALKRVAAAVELALPSAKTNISLGRIN